jgi:tRNA threonylcarbamoyladenosine biosynthesis protein TsaB
VYSLALETSGRVGSVAICRDGTLVAEREYPHGLQHAAALVPLIDELAASLGLRAKDFRELYVSVGPGSFTGIRVGVTLAKTLAFATCATIVAVPTVRVLVENAASDATNAIVVLDAKRGQIFTARFARQNGEWREAEPAHLDTLAAMLVRAPRPVHLIGEGIDFHRDAIPAGDASIVACDPSTWRARASVVARLGHAMARRGEKTDPLALSPIYIRLAEAEEKRLASLNSGTN